MATAMNFTHIAFYHTTWKIAICWAILSLAFICAASLCGVKYYTRVGRPGSVLVPNDRIPEFSKYLSGKWEECFFFPQRFFVDLGLMCYRREFGAQVLGCA
jgi:hypothetical protein